MLFASHSTSCDIVISAWEVRKDGKNAREREHGLVEKKEPSLLSLGGKAFVFSFVFLCLPLSSSISTSICDLDSHLSSLHRH